MRKDEERCGRDHAPFKAPTVNRWGFFSLAHNMRKRVFYENTRKKASTNSICYGNGDAVRTVGGADDAELQRSVYAVVHQNGFFGDACFDRGVQHGSAFGCDGVSDQKSDQRVFYIHGWGRGACQLFVGMLLRFACGAAVSSSEKPKNGVDRIIDRSRRDGGGKLAAQLLRNVPNLYQVPSAGCHRRDVSGDRAERGRSVLVLVVFQRTVHLPQGRVGCRHHLFGV